MKWQKLKEIEEQCNRGELIDPEVVLELVYTVRRLDRRANTWRYSDGMRHPLDMD